MVSVTQLEGWSREANVILHNARLTVRHSGLVDNALSLAFTLQRTLAFYAAVARPLVAQLRSAQPGILGADDAGDIW